MKFENVPDLGPYFTFSPSKSKPIYNWFFYKEAYSPEAVEFFINKFQLKKGKIVDPFCGIGTTPLYSKSKGFESYATDVSPIAVFASNVKCANYSQEDVEELKSILKSFSKEMEKLNPSIKWKTELFSPEKIFPKSSLNFILKTREFISSMENKEMHNLFLLALVSILPQSSLLIKDGGVLKFDKRKSAFPAKQAFKKKIKKMISDLEKNPIKGPVPEIKLGDARKIEQKNDSIDAVITSPPYLNNIDYTKLYGLELSLLSLDPLQIKSARKDSLSSFHGAVQGIDKVPPEVEEFGLKYPLIGAYFSDMEKVIQESYRILKPGSSAVFIVGNSIIHDMHILVDELFGEIGERIGFKAEIITSLKRFASKNRSRIETRESAVVLKK